MIFVGGDGKLLGLSKGPIVFGLPGQILFVSICRGYLSHIRVVLLFSLGLKSLCRSVS